MCACGNSWLEPRAQERGRPFRYRSLALLLAAWFCAPSMAVQLEEHRVEDLDYGRSLYHFFQEKELAAITHLMVAAERPRARAQLDQSDLLLADLYYGYGLYDESRELFARLLTEEVSESVQNRIWFNLARLRYEQGFYDHARDLLARIDDRLPPAIEAERKYLLTNLYLGNRQYDEATKVSKQIKNGSIWKIYARYNLGVSLIEDEDYKKGRSTLESIGELESLTPEMLALRDRANLSLGLKLLRMELPEPALESLSRVRLEGPLSHDALLASGWAWYRMNQPEKALVPWRYLLRRNAVDAATQEAILAIPASYAESGQEQLAVRHYEIAAKQFDAQLQLLTNAIGSIENDGLIAALREHSILFDRASLQRLPPSSDVTPQLQSLLASTEFQREIKRYQQLLDIRNSLGYWGVSFPALKLMLEEREANFQRNLPKLQQSTSFDQLELLVDRRDQFAQQVNEIEQREDYTALADADERDHLERMQRVSAAIDKVGADSDTNEQQDMLRLLSGLLHYELATDFPVRFWKSKKQLILLERALNESDERVGRLRGIVASTEREFENFRGRISGQAQRILDLHNRVTDLLKKQEQLINRMAIASIREQQQHIVQLRLNARFELAKLYDKMAAEQ